MILSVVTIVRNNPQVIDTIRSLSRQKPGEWDLLVVDGASTDGTSESIDALLETVSFPFRHLREPDSGISDALNKGMRLAAGEWIIFLNAGDMLHPEFDLSRFIPRLGASNADVLCGDAWMESDKRAWRSRGDWTLLDQADHFWNPICHQATFFRRAVHLGHPYDKRLRYTMDLDVLLRMRNAGVRFESLDEIVCSYRLGGLTSSDHHYRRNHAEHDLVNRLNGRVPTIGRSTSLLLRNMTTGFARRVMGPWLTSLLRRLLGRR